MDLRYAGMTVNERLFASGLLDDLKLTVRAGDRGGIIAILQEVEIGDQAGAVADQILAAPGRYGLKSS